MGSCPLFPQPLVYGYVAQLIEPVPSVAEGISLF